MPLPPVPPPLPAVESVPLPALVNLLAEYRLLQRQLATLPREVPSLSPELEAQAQRANEIMQQIRSLEKDNLWSEEVRSSIDHHLCWMKTLNFEVKKFVGRGEAKWIRKRIRLAAKEALDTYGYDASAIVTTAKQIFKDITQRGEDAKNMDDLCLIYETNNWRLMMHGNNLHKKVAQYRMKKVFQKELEPLLYVDKYDVSVEKAILEQIADDYREKVLEIRQKLEDLLKKSA